MRIVPVVFFSLLLFGSFSLALDSKLFDAMIVREPNITLNYSRMPWVLRGVTPRFVAPPQLNDDTIQLTELEPVRLDPRTCPGDIALCYHVRTHNYTGEITYGSNYTAASKYVLPEKRIRTFVCVGDDLECVRQATNCFCSGMKVPRPPRFFGVGACDQEQHICRSSYAGMTLCEGNLTSCEERFISCGCGLYSTCTSSKINTCLNDRNVLFSCNGPLPSCLARYETCFCDQEMMSFQEGCTTKRHECREGLRNVTCIGSFTECALKYDVCEC